MRNTPVLITNHGTRGLYVFPDFTTGGRCTGRTTSGRRCRNAAWDEGQVAGYETIYLEDVVVGAYGPLPGDVEQRYMQQRCRVHDSPDSTAFCDPEWERFDPVRHRDMTSTPSYTSLFFGTTPPPPRIVVLALREHCTYAERQALARLLTDDPALFDPQHH